MDPVSRTPHLPPRGCLDAVMECEGYVWLLRDMHAAEADIQGYHPVEPAVGIDIGEVKTGFGDRSATIKIDAEQGIAQNP